MSNPSYQNFSDHTFESIIPALDRVQGRCTSNVMQGPDVAHCVRVYEDFAKYGTPELVYYTAFSFKRDRFPPRCTCMHLTTTGGTVSRQEAPPYLNTKSRWRVRLPAPYISWPLPKFICGLALLPVEDGFSGATYG